MTAVARSNLDRLLSGDAPPARPQWVASKGSADFLPWLTMVSSSFAETGGPQGLTAEALFAPQQAVYHELLSIEWTTTGSYTVTVGTSLAVKPGLVGPTVEALIGKPPTITYGSDVREVIAPDVEEYAKRARIYVWLKVAKVTVKETFSSLRGMTLELLKDPEGEEDDSTICFRLAVRESIDEIVRLDRTFQETLYQRLPPAVRNHFSFLYDFV